MEEALLLHAVASLWRWHAAEWGRCGGGVEALLQCAVAWRQWRGAGQHTVEWALHGG